MAKRAKPASKQQLRIKQIRSTSGRPAKQRATLRALGLRHHQQTVVQNDTPAIRGMLFQVRHMVAVEEVGEAKAEE